MVVKRQPVEIDLLDRSSNTRVKMVTASGTKHGTAGALWLSSILVKGSKEGEIHTSYLMVLQVLPDIAVNIPIKDVKTTATKHELIVPESPDGSGDGMKLIRSCWNLKHKFEDSGIDKVVVVGNGLYLEQREEFSVSTSEIAVADIMNSQKLEG